MYMYIHVHVHTSETIEYQVHVHVSAYIMRMLTYRPDLHVLKKPCTQLFFVLMGMSLICTCTCTCTCVHILCMYGVLGLGERFESLNFCLFGMPSKLCYYSHYNVCTWTPSMWLILWVFQKSGGCVACRFCLISQSNDAKSE